MDIYSFEDYVCSIDRSPLPPVKVTYLTDLKKWELVETYTVRIRDYRFTIASGYRFDLASIPRAVWWAIAPFELSIVAPLIHDFLYDFDGSVPPESVDPDHVFTRKEADLIFRDLMRVEGVTCWRRVVAYRAVRWFGGRYWN